MRGSRGSFVDALVAALGHERVQGGEQGRLIGWCQPDLRKLNTGHLVR